jgi:hypothetical protein
MNAFLQSLGDYLPSGNLLSGRTAALPRELLGPVEYSARKQRALMTRWSSVLHSKDLPFPLGLADLRSTCPCAKRRVMDL